MVLNAVKQGDTPNKTVQKCVSLNAWHPAAASPLRGRSLWVFRYGMVLALVGWGMVLALVVSNQPIPQHIPQQSTQPIDMIRVQQDIESC